MKNSKVQLNCSCWHNHVICNTHLLSTAILENLFRFLCLFPTHNTSSCLHYITNWTGSFLVSMKMQNKMQCIRMVYFCIKYIATSTFSMTYSEVFRRKQSQNSNNFWHTCLYISEGQLFQGQSVTGSHHFAPRPCRMPWIPTDNNSCREMGWRVQLGHDFSPLSGDHTPFKWHSVSGCYFTEISFEVDYGCG